MSGTDPYTPTPQFNPYHPYHPATRPYAQPPPSVPPHHSAYPPHLPNPAAGYIQPTYSVPRAGIPYYPRPDQQSYQQSSFPPYQHPSHPSPLSPFPGPPYSPHPQQPSPIPPIALPLPHSAPQAPPIEPQHSASVIKLVVKRPQVAAPDREPATFREPTLETMVKTEEEYTLSGRPARGARAAAQKKSIYYEGDDDDDFEGAAEEEEEEDEAPVVRAGTRRSDRSRKGPGRYGDDDDDDDFENSMLASSPLKQEVSGRRTSGRSRRIVDPDDEADAEGEEEQAEVLPVSTRRQSASARQNAAQTSGPTEEQSKGRQTRSSKRAKSRGSSAGAESFNPSATESVSDGVEESDDPLNNDFHSEEDLDSDSPSPRRARRRRQPPPRPVRRSTRNSRRTAPDSEEEFGAPKRQLRERTSKVNYQLPPLDISAELVQEAIAGVSAPGRRARVGFTNVTRFGAGASGGNKSLPWDVRGHQLGQAMGDPDSSDSDMDLITPGGSGGGGGQAAVGGTGMRATAPSDVPNFGRINPKSNMADADPLGVDMNVTFDNVGGLDGHINQLKEMVALPLLYPELFQQFGITPPRGVLFHGPPGTGKTLLARALAASCSNGNTKISFFMRKGADVLSKWVGEAERQLRMLFEEARAAQPSIIFFDEIDGLAPVRSSKQDQIHASLVSTLLALMDGMDGRGQVIVIGATNRPDAVDPALRRPGRFDREFYFPLPNKEARRKIISINTRKWSPSLSDETLDHLALLTKGYGGADLRALCTEAALNAIQRRYPQIYSSQDRLLLDPSSIKVGAKDFMLSVKKIIPSSARSSSSAAIQLPPHLAPLLERPLERVKAAVDRVLPRHKHKTALEEAEFEDEIGDDLDKHVMVQSLDRMRTFRPRVLVHGPSGMGQGYIGPAILHHLEGFHVQSLDLGALMGDSTRTLEAGLVQLFVEAKRHQPSVLFIPSLLTWSLALPDSARITFASLLESVPSSDPVLLLAILDGSVNDLPKDVRRWFGVGKEGRVALTPPTADEREAYFAPLVEAFCKPPVEFPDALPRRKRVLEILPSAPPPPPRQPTEAELKRELDRDNNARNMMTISFTGILPDLTKKYRKVVASIRSDSLELSHFLQENAAAEAAAAAAAVSGSGAAETSAAGAASVVGVLENNTLPNGTGLGAPVVIHQETTSVPAIVHSQDSESQPVAPIDLLSATQDESALPGGLTAPGADTAAEDASPEPVPARVWRAHDVDLDTLHRRLFRHKYCTPQDFLDDIDKIEDNARHIGDPDRMAKIAEMAANVRMHVLGFDPKWTPEFERLKARTLARKEERVREKERERNLAAKENGKEALQTNGVSAGGDPVEIAVEAAGDGEAADSSLKRSRQEEESEEQRAGKRARDDAMDVDPSASLSEPTESLAVPTASSSAPTDESVAASHPPFICPREAVAGLASAFKHATVRLNLDQLEQLRAGCYDRLWRSRAAWDRTAVLAECTEWVGEYVREVQELEEDW